VFVTFVVTIAAFVVLFFSVLYEVLQFIEILSSLGKGGLGNRSLCVEGGGGGGGEGGMCNGSLKQDKRMQDKWRFEVGEVDRAEPLVVSLVQVHRRVCV
jgi:hypothetical protein